MSWYGEFNSTFWISTGTLLAGILALFTKSIYRSKCAQVDVCYGLFTVIRDTRDEVILDLENNNNRRHETESEIDTIPSPRNNL
jgi:hypothetical protein